MSVQPPKTQRAVFCPCTMHCVFFFVLVAHIKLHVSNNVNRFGAQFNGGILSRNHHFIGLKVGIYSFPVFVDNCFLFVLSFRVHRIKNHYLQCFSITKVITLAPKLY